MKLFKNVRDIFRRQTPIIMAQQVPWADISKCVVVYQERDGQTIILASNESKASDLVWFGQCVLDAGMSGSR